VLSLALHHTAPGLQCFLSAMTLGQALQRMDWQ
jgi:hypothetical protein